MVVNTDQEIRFVDLRHPDYSDLANNWQLWRDAYTGGEFFIQRYLKTFSAREDPSDFAIRQQVTYCPCFAGAAIDDERNNIYQHMQHITRAGGSPTYQAAIMGDEDGVDLLGSSMNYFVGQKILTELLVMKKVGVYVDMPPTSGSTLLDTTMMKARPYIYMYRAEEILNWTFDLSSGPNEYKSILLRESYNTVDPQYGFPSKVDTRFRYMFQNEDGVGVRYFNTQNKPIDMFGSLSDSITYQLDITRIPFIIFELPHSLMKDIAKCQIALLNMESSDISYILKANFPFYTEQQDSRAATAFTRDGSNADGTASTAQASGSKDVNVGTAAGRAYAQGMDRPGFIHPSPEPLQASMLKQEQIKRSIRQLINLAITNMAPTKQQSAESKDKDNQGLEAGLAAIGLELERGERKVAQYWSMYEKNTKPATVKYPRKYSSKSEADRRAETDQYRTMIPIVPSLTFQKCMAKGIVHSLIGDKISREELDTIESEIDKAKFVLGDPTQAQKDVELGTLDRANYAEGRCYPNDAIAQANREHADRLVRIAESQATGQSLVAPAARGVPDTSANPAQDAVAEKTASRNTDLNGQATIPVRGQGQ